MPKASNMQMDSNFSFLFKGGPGMAKTCAAASAAILGPVHISYWDKQKPVELEKYFRHIIKRPELLDNIDYDVYGATNANEWLNKIFEWGDKGCRYVAVITDSLTTLTSGAVGWSMGFKDGKKFSRDPKDLNLIPDWDDYKIETSMVVQALDVLMSLNTNVIWTAHPLTQTKLDATESGKIQRVTQTTSLVTYGNKVAGLVPGRFTEIYHFGKEIDYNTNPTSTKYMCYTDSIGDDFARSALLLPERIDHTNRLFFEVWKEALDKLKGV